MLAPPSFGSDATDAPDGFAGDEIVVSGKFGYEV